MAPRQHGLGNPDAGQAPHGLGLPFQVRQHAAVVRGKAARHLELIRGIQRPVGEADLLHPLGKPPVTAVAFEKARAAVPLGRHGAAVHATERVQVDVVGLDESRLGAVAAQVDEGAVPVFAPPRVVLGLERFGRSGNRGGKIGFRRRDEDAAVRAARETGRPHQAVDRAPREPRGLDEHGELASPQRIGACRKEVLHSGIGQMRPRFPGLNLIRTEPRAAAGHAHRLAPLLEFHARSAERLRRVLDIDGKHFQPGVSPDGDAGAAGFHHDASARQVQPLTEAGARGPRSGIEGNPHVPGTDVIEEPRSGGRVRRGQEAPRIGFGKVQAQAPVPSHHRRKVAAAHRHRFPGLRRGSRVNDVVARNVRSAPGARGQSAEQANRKPRFYCHSRGCGAPDASARLAKAPAARGRGPSGRGRRVDRGAKCA